MRFPWLSANTYNAGTNQTHYQPYIVKEVNGVRVGVLGLTTPDIPYWEDKKNYAGLEFHEPLVEARKWVEILRNRERVDVVIVTMHMGLEQEVATRIAESYDRETSTWLKRVIGTSSAGLSLADARFRDSALLDLVQRVQLDAGQADVSMAASFNPQARLPKGNVTVRDIAGLYVYDNTLVVIEVTGQQLKDALEHSARFFREDVPGKTPSELVDTRIPDYNFDVAEGVTYELDITRPTGQRIQNLRFKGQPLSQAQKLRLATNNYRVSGGGGYTMYKGAPEVSRSSKEIRDMIIEWVEPHKRVPSEPTNNWRLIPPANR